MVEHRRRVAAGLLVSALALALAGCGDLPKPFVHDRVGQPLTRLETAGRVSVAPSAEPQQSALLIQSLLSVGVPAREEKASATETAEGGYRALAQSDPDRVRWQLLNPEGTVILSRSLSPADGLNAEVVQQLARAISDAVGKDMEAPLVTRMSAPAPDPIPGLRPPPETSPVGVSAAPSASAPAPAPAPLDTLPSLALGTVGGFGGGRDDILRGALETSLTRAGLKLSPDGPFVIDGDVTQEVIAGVTRLRVVWTVRGPDGDDVGTISQENPVEEDFLTSQFPALAVAIADGGTEGVYAMISRLRVDPAVLQTQSKDKSQAVEKK